MSGFAWIISGIIAGWPAGTILQGRVYGLLGDLLVGLIGGCLAGVFALPATSWAAQILVAALGGVVFVLILYLIHPGEDAGASTCADRVYRSTNSQERY